MSEPVRFAYSLDEMRANVKRYMLTIFGKPTECENRDAWYTRAGLLTDFVETMWHEMPPNEPPVNGGADRG